MDKKEILKWLRENNDSLMESLWAHADRIRKQNVGDEVHLRGLVEISNYCVRECAYCGVRKPNTQLERYRMTEDEIIKCAHETERLGYGTIVLQSGEDCGIVKEWFAKVIRRIKSETSLAVTLSLGERSDDDLKAWREAGADRYLLKFETSDNTLYNNIHPPLSGKISDRIKILKTLRKNGYETGSGVMIGLPRQTLESLADDIELFRELDLDMIGVGPFIPHPKTPLYAKFDKDSKLPFDRLLTTYKVIALTRIVCSKSNIPATTALNTLNNKDGYEKGLMRGANVIMPNLTPVKYKSFYDIYPSTARMDLNTTDYHENIKRRIHAIGRKIGLGPGDSLRHKELERQNRNGQTA